MDEPDELDEFMTKIEEMGILTGWSKFMGREGDKEKENELL